MHCFSFDIETVPDVESGRRLLDLDGLSDEDVATAMTFKRLQAAGHDFLPLHQHRVVAISVALRSGDSFSASNAVTAALGPALEQAVASGVASCSRASAARAWAAAWPWPPRSST